MSKRQPRSVRKFGSGGTLVDKPAPPRLKIGQIRALLDHIKTLPENAQLPDWTHLSIGDRFAVALRLLPPADWQRLLGKSKKQLDRYAAGTEIPTLVTAALARHAELPIDWIVSGRPLERRAPVIYVAGDDRKFADDIPIERLAFQASAGRGALTLNERAGYMHFSRALLDQIDVRPQYARLLFASGISMAPTIQDGDLMLVDMSSTEIVDGQIYLFSIGDEAFVKRLRRRARSLVMSSDNRELYPDDDLVPDEQPFRIYGRVRWAGRSL